MTDRNGRYLGSLGFGKRYWRPDPDCLRQRERIDAYCADIADNIRAGKGLSIVGPVGTGKSHALAYIGLTAEPETQKQCRVRYVFGPELFRQLHIQGEDVAEYRDCHLLLLDDLDRLYVADWSTHQFESFMEARYANLRATVLTANRMLTPDQDTQLERTLDRLRETNEVVIMGGESQR